MKSSLRLFLYGVLSSVLIYSCTRILEVVDMRVVSAEFAVTDVEEGDSSFLDVFVKEGDDSCLYFLKWSLDKVVSDSLELPMKLKKGHGIPLGVIAAGEHSLEGLLRRADGGANVVDFSTSFNVTKKTFKASFDVSDVTEGRDSYMTLTLDKGDQALYSLSYTVDGGKTQVEEFDLVRKESCDISLGRCGVGTHVVKGSLSRKDGLGTPQEFECSWEVTGKQFTATLSVADVEEGAKAHAVVVLKSGDATDYNLDVRVDKEKVVAVVAGLEAGVAYDVELPVMPAGTHVVDVMITRKDGLGSSVSLSDEYGVGLKSMEYEIKIADVNEGEVPVASVVLVSGDECNYSYILTVDNSVAAEGSVDLVTAVPVDISLVKAYAMGKHEFIMTLWRTDGLGVKEEVTGKFEVAEKRFAVKASVGTVIYGNVSTLSLTLTSGEDTSYDVKYSVDKGTMSSTKLDMVKGTSKNISLGKCSTGSHSVSGTVTRTDGLGSEVAFTASFTVDPDLSPDEVVFSRNDFSISMDESVTVTAKVTPTGANQGITVTRKDSGSAKITYSVSGNTITLKGGATGGSVRLKVASSEDESVYEYLEVFVKHRVAIVLDVTSKATEGPWQLMPTSASMKFVTWTGTVSPSDPTMKGVVLSDFTERYSYKASVYIHANPVSMASISLKGDQPNFYWDTGTDWTYNGKTQSGRQWCLWSNRIRVKSNITSSPCKAASVSTLTNSKYNLKTLVNPETDNKKTVDQGYLIWNNNHRKWYDGVRTWIYSANSPGKDEPSTNAWKAFYMTVSDIELNWDELDVKYIFHMYRTKPNGNWYNGGYWWQPVDSGNWAVPVAESDKK